MTRDSIGWSITVGIAIGLIGLYTHIGQLTVDLIFAFGFFFGAYMSSKIPVRKEASA